MNENNCFSALTLINFNADQSTPYKPYQSYVDSKRRVNEEEIKEEIKVKNKTEKTKINGQRVEEDVK